MIKNLIKNTNRMHYLSEGSGKSYGRNLDKRVFLMSMDIASDISKGRTNEDLQKIWHYYLQRQEVPEVKAC